MGDQKPDNKSEPYFNIIINLHPTDGTHWVLVTRTEEDIEDLILIVYVWVVEVDVKLIRGPASRMMKLMSLIMPMLMLMITIIIMKISKI